MIKLFIFMRDAILDYFYKEDCPECGSPIRHGRCTNKARHNGGVDDEITI